MIPGPISATLLPSWLAQVQKMQRRARRTKPARLTCLQMLSACSWHANAVVQPLWRDVCVGVVHSLGVVLALLALLALRPLMCSHPAETLLLPVCLLPVVPACHYPCSTIGACRERSSAAPATFFTRRTQKRRREGDKQKEGRRKQDKETKTDREKERKRQREKAIQRR